MENKFVEVRDIQNIVQQFTEEQCLETHVSYRVLDLVSEVGELSKEVLKGSQYGKMPFCCPETWKEELADVFFSLICLANSTDVNLEEELFKALQKYRKRLRDKGDAGSGQ